MGGIKNDVMVAKNADFTQAAGPNATSGESNGLVTNGQLWIGATSTNAGGTHINVGVLTSPDNSLTIGYTSPNITIQANNSHVGETITGDTGGALSPTAGNWNILGKTDSVSQIMETDGSGSTLNVENRTWQTSLVVDASTTAGSRGTYSTIQAAINAAVSGQTVFIRPGTYTENLTLKAGVNLASWAAGPNETEPTIILGKTSFTAAGNVTITGITLKTNSDYAISVTGSAASKLILKYCYVLCSNNTGIQLTSTGGAYLAFFNTNLEVTTTGIALYTHSSSATMNFKYCIVDGSSQNTANASSSTGNVTISWCYLNTFFTQSSSNTYIVEFSSVFAPGAQVAFTLSGTNAINLYDTSLESGGSAAVLSVGSGCNAYVYRCQVKSGATNAVTGAGSIKYGPIVFTDGIGCNVTSQTPVCTLWSAARVTTPGAYPYTATPQDGVILVDTSSARTINLNASPTTGQTYVIKDNVGSAAANNITVTPAAGNIDGAASYTINVNYGSITIVYNGTQWNVI